MEIIQVVMYLISFIMEEQDCVYFFLEAVCFINLFLNFTKFQPKLKPKSLQLKKERNHL
jgi:hypothetical protein